MKAGPGGRTIGLAMTTEFEPFPSPSAFRKLAAGMWRAPNDPTIYGAMDVDATAALAHVAKLRAEGTRVTITHLVVRAVALAIAQNPDVNAKVRFWGKLERRKSVDVFVQASTDGGRDLSGARIVNADQKSLLSLADEIAGASKTIRQGGDATYDKSRGLLRSLPWWLTRLFIGLSDTLVNELHFDLPKQGMPRDPFGSAMVTSVGMFGIDTAFAPFTPIGRCPMLILIPEVRDRPWVEDGKLVVRPVLRLCATFDHRVIDGFQAGKLARDIGALLREPETL